jgi:hypothetical protein
MCLILILVLILSVPSDKEPKAGRGNCAVLTVLAMEATVVVTTGNPENDILNVSIQLGRLATLFLSKPRMVMSSFFVTMRSNRRRVSFGAMSDSCVSLVSEMM